MGAVLLYLAVEESLAAGYRGRLVLNSLASAETFYRRARTTDMGGEDCGEDGLLTRFEFDAASAEAFKATVLGIAA